MSIVDGRDYLLLLWQAEISRRVFVIGKLSKNGQYEFTYSDNVDEAIAEGFHLLIPFEDKNKVYTSDVLFPIFSSRLPEEKRKGIEDILKKYGLTEYEEFKLLKRSGAKLPIDTLRFVDPIFDVAEKTLTRNFYIAGPRHCMPCDGKQCDNAVKLEVGDKLTLMHEPTNLQDCNAVKILFNTRCIGYLPRYYCESVLKLLNSGFSYSCIVTEVNTGRNCSECIMTKLTLIANS